MKVWEKLAKYKRTLIVSGCLVVLAIGGLITWLLWPPSQQSVQGQWTGSVTVSAPGVADQSRPAQASLTQNGQQVTGTITTDQPTSVSGVIQGNTVTLSVNNQATLSLTLANQRLSGITTLQKPGEVMTIAVDLSRVGSVPLAGSTPPLTTPVSVAVSSPQPVAAPVQPITTPAQPVVPPLRLKRSPSRSCLASIPSP